MSIGATIRRLFGKHERSVAEAYRRIFVDLDTFSALIRHWVPTAGNILEVGCGEGALTERLSLLYPTSRITAIDISPRLGRLYAGRTDDVTFLKETIESVAERMPHCFDLVVLSDVIHHVPTEMRTGLLVAIRNAMAPHARFVFKDWAASTTPIHAMCFASDRYLTGDRVVYLSEENLQSAAKSVFGESAILSVERIKPWKNNLAMLITEMPRLEPLRPEQHAESGSAERLLH